MLHLTTHRRSTRSPLRTAVDLIAMCVLFLGATGCSDGNSATEPTTTAPPDHDIPNDRFVSLEGQTRADVNVIDNSYEERYITIDAGTSVVWTNNGAVEHNITPKNESDFDGVGSEEFKPGAVHEAVFTTPGDFQYYCTIHGTLKNGQNGIIRVVAP